MISKPLAKGARAARPGRPALPIPIGVMLMFGIPFLRRRVLPFVPVRLLGWPDVAQYRIAFPNDKLKVRAMLAKLTELLEPESDEGTIIGAD